MDEIFSRFETSIDIEKAKIDRCLTTISKLNKLMYEEIKTYLESQQNEDQTEHLFESAPVRSAVDTLAETQG